MTYSNGITDNFNQFSFDKPIRQRYQQQTTEIIAMGVESGVMEGCIPPVTNLGLDVPSSFEKKWPKFDAFYDF